MGLVTVRHANKRDLPEMIRIIKELHQASSYRDIHLSEIKSANFLSRCIGEEDRLTLAAISEADLIGILIAEIDWYFFSEQKLAVDVLFYVRPSFRGSRAAVQLVREYKNWAIEKGAREICLSTTTGVEPDRTAKFFSRNGFNIVGTIHKFRAKI